MSESPKCSLCGEPMPTGLLAELEALRKLAQLIIIISTEPEPWNLETVKFVRAEALAAAKEPHAQD